MSSLARGSNGEIEIQIANQDDDDFAEEERGYGSDPDMV